MSPRDTVLNSALELFTHKGYFNTSMRDITRESQVSTGSIYHYFRDKEGVAAALYQSLLERMQGELQQISQQHDSAEAQCHAVIRLLFEIADAEPQVMAFMLYTKHREFLPGERPICSSVPFEQMREMVRRGMQRGEIRQGDVLVASSCLFGGSIRMITSALDGLLQQPLSGFLDEVWDYSWRAVAAQA
jgi:AcrR family transcriptional regulator